MAKTLGAVADKVLYRLGDTAESIWNKDEIRRYLTEGYDQLAIQTECFWDQAYLEDRLTTANITAGWEFEFFLSGWVATGVFKYTSPAEKDYLQPGDLEYGPTTLNHLWESTYLASGYSFYRATDFVPDSLYQIDRATWDYKKIEPVRSTEIEIQDARYWIQNGEVIGYIQDKDGLGVFRKWRVPSVAATAYTITGTGGILRTLSDISSDTVVGTWGIPRRIPSMHPMGDTGGWGIPRRPYQDVKNTRIEFSRRGRLLEEDTDEFELPDRYVVYVRHYAMWKALERNSNGQDLEFAAHWQARFMAGIARMIKRKNALSKNRRFAMISEPLNTQSRPPLARLPWQFGRVVGYPTT